MEKNTYTIEITDTFSGEANYSWVRRYLVKAKSQLGAINALSRKYGAGWKKEYEIGDISRYKLSGACVCCFVEYVDLDGWCDLGGVNYEHIN